VPDGLENNAMAEIAFALAMGFFSILVLTLVSVGSGLTVGPTGSSAARLSVSPAAPIESAGPASEGPLAAPVLQADNLVIYYAGQFFDVALRPVDPKRQSARPGLVLAFDPALPLVETIRAREKISAPDLMVTVLDQRWLDRLKAAP
jgi:hypothetical protein